MTDTPPFPDNAWLTYREATQRWGNQTSKYQVEYISRAAHDAAVSAARKEGMLDAAGISLAAAAGYAQGGRRLKGAILARALGMQAAAESIAESIRHEANK